MQAETNPGEDVATLSADPGPHMGLANREKELITRAVAGTNRGKAATIVRKRCNQGNKMTLKQGADFDGETYVPTLDKARLTGQLLRVYEIMRRGDWVTLRELADRAAGSEPSVSARLRDLRKEKFGGMEVKRRRRDGGLWEYRLVVDGQLDMFGGGE